MGVTWNFGELRNGDLFTVPDGRLPGVWEKRVRSGIVTNANKIGTDDWAALGPTVEVETFDLPADSLTFGELAPGDTFTMPWDPIPDSGWMPGIWRKALVDVPGSHFNAYAVGLTLLGAAVDDNAPVNRLATLDTAGL